MGEGGRIQNMCWRDSFCVAGIGAHGRQRTTIQNTFDLNDDGVECVHVKDISFGRTDEMPFEQAYAPFPHAAIRWSTRRNEGPFQTFFGEGIDARVSPQLHLLPQDSVSTNQICASVRNERRYPRSSRGESGNRID